MVFTLHRYIFRELFKVFVLAAIALTLILSLCSILRPVQEYGIGPRQVFHIMGYFLPITLTFVLPMAALFAAAQVYGRLAGDNELDACKASGISFLTLVYSGLAMAIIVSIANLLLSFYVMPYFVQLAEKSIKADAKQILFRNIQSRGYYPLPPDNRYLIYADHVDSYNDMLSGVVVIGVKDNSIEKIIAAQTVKIHFDPYDRFNEVKMTAYKTNQMGAADDLWYSVGLLSLRKEFGSLLGDDIKFKRIYEMKQIRSNLMLFDPVAKLARQTFSQFIAEMLAQSIARTTADDQTRFYELPGQTRTVRFTAGKCTAQSETELRLSDGVVVEEYDTQKSKLLHTLRCEKAAIHIDSEELPPALTLDLQSARIQGSNDLHARYIITGLTLPKTVAGKTTSKKLLAAASSRKTLSRMPGPPSAELKHLQATLRREIRRTLLEITGEIHSRLVFGIGVLPMILIGIALGVVKKGGHILSAFGASCVPAAVLAVAIVSGNHITKNPMSQGVAGMVVMWSGLALLCLLVLALYQRLLRN